MKQSYPAASRLFIRLLSLFLFLGLACPAALQAQSYQLPATGTTSITTCSGTLYDDGGPGGPYTANANGSVTISPATAGNKIRLQFTYVDVETGYDWVYIYDGNTVSSPLIGAYNASNQPGTVYATSASGALTVRLTSDGVVQQSGFAATIGCVATAPTMLADLAVQGAYLSSSSVVAGGSLAANCSIYNLSGAVANTTTVGYYLSSNAVLDAGDQLLSNTQGYYPLSAGQSAPLYATVTVPAGTAAGSYYILFAADYLNQVSESNETNNVTAVSFQVIPSSVDLTIQQASVSPQNTAVGNPLGLSCSIVNLGNATASSSSVGFYFSTNATLDAADQLLTSQYGSQLAPPYSSSRYGTAAVPAGTAPGTYYILFVADYQNQVTESNENNNVTAVSITVSPPGVDLVMQQEQLYPNSTVAGNTLQASASILNQGNTTAASSTVGFYLSTNQVFDASDVLLATVIGGQLGANQNNYRSAYPVIPAATAPGNYYVLFVADPQNAVAETNEANNVNSLFLTVMAPTVDLLVQNPYLSPTSVAPGGTTSASCYLYNQGNSVTNLATVGYYLSTNQVLDASDVLLGNTTGSLYGNGYASRYANLTVPAGTAVGSYYILFVADYLNQVAETNETNNVSTTTLQVVAPGVDLSISQAYLAQYSTAPGNNLGTSCYIQNTGNTTASSSTVGYYLSTNQVFDASDVLLLTSPGYALGAGQYFSRYDSPLIPVGTAPGSYYVLFVADPSNVVAETNEANNVASQPLQIVAPSIDLTISQAYVYPSTTAAGNTVNVNCYVQNLGNATASSSTIGYYLSTNQVLDASDVLLRTTTGGTLGAGQYSSRYEYPVVPASTAPGNYYVLFVADPQNAVAETNEANNVASAALLVVAPGIDLLIQQSYLSASSVTPGFAVNGSCYIQNAGNAMAASSTVGFYLSTNQVFDASDVLLNTATGGALASSQSASRYSNLMIPAGTTAGSYYVLYVADPSNVVAETNEANNVAFQPLTVLGPFTGTLVPLSTTVTVTTCATTIYDNGGYGNYADGSFGALTILPGTAGMMVQLVFNSFLTEQTYDYVRVYDGTSVNAPLLGTYSGSQLPLPIMATNAAGALTVQFVSDGGVNYAGFDATASCVAAPQPDLLLTQIGASPSSVAAGGNLSLTASIANQGAGPAASSAVGYYLSTNRLLDASDRLLGISAGAALGTGLNDTRQLTATVPANVPVGAYYVLFVADPLNAEAETDETNNLAALPVTVTQALATRELTAGYSVNVAPNPVTSGGTLRVQLSGTGANCAAELSLYNALGQRVRSQPLLLGAGRANQAAILTQNLATGVYILRLTGPDLSVTRRVVIE